MKRTENHLIVFPRRNKSSYANAQADVLKTPFLQQTLFCNEPNQGNCITCGTSATAQHIIWMCPIYRNLRGQILLSLGPLRPQMYREWVDPTGCTRRKAEETLRTFVAFVLHPDGPNQIVPGPRPSPTLPSNPPPSSKPFHRTA